MGSYALKVLVVIFNIILTILVILAITGVICACAFAVYINNYVDTEIDETMFRFTEVVKAPGETWLSAAVNAIRKRNISLRQR